MNNFIIAGIFTFFVLLILGYLVIFWTKIKPVTKYVPYAKTLFFILLVALILFSLGIGYKILNSSQENPKNPQKIQLNL